MSNNNDNASFTVDTSNESPIVVFKGSLNIQNIKPIQTPLQHSLTQIKDKQKVQFDVSSVDSFDSAGIIFLSQQISTLNETGCEVNITGVKPEIQRMIDFFQEKGSGKKDYLKGRKGFLSFLEDLGKTFVDWLHDITAFIGFVGESFIALIHYVLHPGSIRFRAIIKNIEEAGVRALPIVALTSFLIGVVVAYQGAVQLEKFGANIFIVDLIGISVTRELAPLITAIVVAGRSGSSYTAQIGVMKITEEIDAMKTMSFDPMRFLVLPRMIALMIAMPLMIFFADIVGIFGGMFISEIQVNLSYSEFIGRLQNILETKHVWIGVFKGLFFAWLIAAVGCFRGFQVSYNTESIGRYTTISVVNSIFLVIACDALFSVFFTELGI